MFHQCNLNNIMLHVDGSSGSERWIWGCLYNNTGLRTYASTREKGGGLDLPFGKRGRPASYKNELNQRD